MRFSLKFNVNGMVQDCIEMSQYHLSGEQAGDSTAKRSGKIATLATKYTKYEIHFDVCKSCQNTQNIICSVVYVGFARWGFFFQFQF